MNHATAIKASVKDLQQYSQQDLSILANYYQLPKHNVQALAENILNKHFQRGLLPPTDDPVLAKFIANNREVYDIILDELPFFGHEQVTDSTRYTILLSMAIEIINDDIVDHLLDNHLDDINIQEYSYMRIYRGEVASSPWGPPIVRYMSQVNVDKFINLLKNSSKNVRDRVLRDILLQSPLPIIKKVLKQFNIEPLAYTQETALDSAISPFAYLNYHSLAPLELVDLLLSYGPPSEFLMQQIVEMIQDDKEHFAQDANILAIIDQIEDRLRVADEQRKLAVQNLQAGYPERQDFTPQEIWEQIQQDLHGGKYTKSARKGDRHHGGK